MNIFISNLGFHVESNDLKAFFAPYGEVTSSKVVTDKETGRSLRYGFVDMPDEESGKEAISKLHGKMVEGRCMSVGISKPKDANKNQPFTNKPARALRY
ncbi:RNA-binding protein [Ilyomonas limi]|uniref:RNA-binding protein n=1 Tax=Ilyomonas limi TaxID=2575867 RepID=A0A4U3KRE0_9BACT|nr:RNA-binding protein [Ilyomonas limi]TKK64189.1 RNA-binding protein [Ilyomonas limi]